MKKKKILFIVPRFHTNLYYQIEALQEAGYKVRVLALYRGFSERYENIDFIEIGYSWIYKGLRRVFVTKRSHLKSPLELKLGFPSVLTLRNEISKFDPDVIFLKAYLNAFALSVFLSMIFKKGKLIILTQTKKDNIKGSVFVLKASFTFARLFGVKLYISPITKTKEVLNKFKGIKVLYLPFAFPVMSESGLNKKGDFIGIMTVGKFVERKEFMLLLEAFRGLVEEGFLSIKLNIFGEKADIGYMRKVENYIKKNKLSKFVRIRYNLDNKEILKEYTKNDVFVLPSRKEPAAYSIVEAMGHGLPVICSSECGTKCYIKSNGFVFESGNVSDLKRKLRLLIRRDNIQKMGVESTKLIKHNHSKKVFIEEIEKIIK